MVLSSGIALSTILPTAEAFDIVFALAMTIVNDILIAMTVAMAIDNALADAFVVVVIHPYQEEGRQIIYGVFFL